MQESIYLKLFGVITPFVIGFIIYFLKDTMNSHKRHGEKIIDIEKNYVKKEELEKKQESLKKEITEYVKEQVKDVKDDIKNLKDVVDENNSKTALSIEKLSEKVSDIQLNYISKEDFLKQNTALSCKMDKLMDMLVEEKTKNACRSTN